MDRQLRRGKKETGKQGGKRLVTISLTNGEEKGEEGEENITFLLYGKYQVD